MLLEQLFSVRSDLYFLYRGGWKQKYDPNDNSSSRTGLTARSWFLLFSLWRGPMGGFRHVYSSCQCLCCFRSCRLAVGCVTKSSFVIGLTCTDRAEMSRIDQVIVQDSRLPSCISGQIPFPAGSISTGQFTTPQSNWFSQLH
jgi:hypothetical protein